MKATLAIFLKQVGALEQVSEDERPAEVYSEDDDDDGDGDGDGDEQKRSSEEKGKKDKDSDTESSSSSSDSESSDEDEDDGKSSHKDSKKAVSILGLGFLRVKLLECEKNNLKVIELVYKPLDNKL